MIEKLFQPHSVSADNYTSFVNGGGSSFKKLFLNDIICIILKVMLALII